MTDTVSPGRDVTARANQLITGGRLEEATRLLENHLNVVPTDHVARSLLGLAAFNGGNYPRAEAVYRTMASLPTRDPRACYSLGITLERLGRIEEARHWLGVAVTADPSFNRARNDLARLSTPSSPPTGRAGRRVITGHNVEDSPDGRALRPEDPPDGRPLRSEGPSFDPAVAGKAPWTSAASTIPGLRRRSALGAVLAAAVAAVPAYFLVAGPLLESLPRGDDWDNIMRLATYRGAFWALIAVAVAACVAVMARDRRLPGLLVQGLMTGAIVGALAGAVDQALRNQDQFGSGVFVSFILLGGALGASGVIGARGWGAAAGGMLGGALYALLITQEIIDGRFPEQVCAAVLIIGGIRAAELLTLPAGVAFGNGSIGSSTPVTSGAAYGPAPGVASRMPPSQFNIPTTEEEWKFYERGTRRKARIDSLNENWYGLPWPIRALQIGMGLAILAAIVYFALHWGEIGAGQVTSSH
jgi:hypothetical protein